MADVRRIALCDLDAVIVRESENGSSWHTVASRMTSREALQLSDELRAAARYLDAKNAVKERP